MATLSPRRTNGRRSWGALGGDHLPPARAPDVSAGATGSGTGNADLSAGTLYPETGLSPRLPTKTLPGTSRLTLVVSAL